MPALTPDQWHKGRALYERAGLSAGAVARELGVSRTSVSKRLNREHWVAPADVDYRREQSASSAKAAADLRWATRRVDEADQAGVTAGLLRSEMLVAAEVKDDKMLRATAYAYNILIGAAQLLSGGATDRPDYGAMTAEEKVVAVRSLVERVRLRSVDGGGAAAEAS